MRISSAAMVVFILGVVALGYMHEQAHVEIYRSYGIESHVEYISHFPDLATVADEPCEVDACRSAHNINDIVGYHLFIIYGVIGLMFIYLIVVVEDKRL